MNTCYCLRLPRPHSRTPECESHRIDRLIRRREFERQWRDDEHLSVDPFALTPDQRLDDPRHGQGDK